MKYKNKIKIKKGGSRARYPDKKGFQAVYDMLGSENSTLSILTTSSLKGFMLKLDIVAGEDGYRTDENVPINSYILKFVVISESVVYLEDFEGNTKQSETRKDFIEEAKMQQSISLASIEQLQHEICPSVANLAIFENKDAEVLLDNLIYMYDLPELKKLTDLFKYLKRQLTGTRGIGILTMPNIIGSQTLYSFNNSLESNNVKLDVKAQLASQVIILFLYFCIIHFDLHSNNSLVFNNPTNGNYETRIIDFGRVSDICDHSKDNYLSSDNKIIINNHLDKFFIEMKSTINTPDEKKDFVRKVLEYIYNLDANRHRGIAQMRWIDEIKNNPDNCLKVYEKLDAIIFSGNAETLTSEKINKYKNKGVIQDLDNPDNYIQKADNLYVSAPDEFASYHSSQNSNISSQGESQESQSTSLSSSQSSVSSQSSRSPSLIFELVNPNPRYREEEFNDRFAEVPVTPVAFAIETTPINSNASSNSVNGTFPIGSTPVNLTINSNAFSSNSASNSASSVKTFTPGLTPAISSIDSDIFEKRKKYRPGEEKGGKRSKKIKNKKNKKRVTKKRKYRSK